MNNYEETDNIQNTISIRREINPTFWRINLHDCMFLLSMIIIFLGYSLKFQTFKRAGNISKGIICPMHYAKLKDAKSD